MVSVTAVVALEGENRFSRVGGVHRIAAHAPWVVVIGGDVR